MSLERSRLVYVFFSYARQDRALRDKLEDHLSNLKYRGLITTWHDREISAGTEWAHQIDIHLNTADIILLLISSNFMASEYCYSIEMKRAIERHEQREARVIPILLRPVLFTDAPFAKLQFLPTNGKPVVNWRNRDSAFVDIALAIEQAVKESEVWVTLESTNEARLRGLLDVEPTLGLDVVPKSTVWQSEEERTYYEQALAAYQQDLRSNSSDASAHRGRGNTLLALRRYSEALEAFERAIALDPRASTYMNMSKVFLKLNRVNEALDALERAIELDPNNADYQSSKGHTLYILQRYEEARSAYDRASELDPAFESGRMLLEDLG